MPETHLKKSWNVLRPKIYNCVTDANGTLLDPPYFSNRFNNILVAFFTQEEPITDLPSVAKMKAQAGKWQTDIIVKEPETGEKAVTYTQRRPL